MSFYLVKFLHLIFALSLLGGTLYSFLAVNSKKFKFRFMNIHLLIFSVFAAITGTFLIYPAHFTFQTPWIQAAYLLLSIFVAAIMGIIFFGNREKKFLLRALYFILFFVLMLIVHDAVVKGTFLL